MKKYRLIKEYPGSPKLGTTVKHMDDFPMYKEIESICYPFLSNIVENHPEFWEEIVEKDYEILSYINDKNNICKLNFDEKQWKQQYVIGNLHIFKIHSIKRLSDSEIFTIGDRIKGFKADEEGFKIKYIFISNNELCFATYSKHEDLDNGRSCYLNNTFPIKLKQPLFTTEDGVDIFENDKIYWINAYTLDDVYCDTYYQDCGEFDLKDGLISIKEFNKLNKDDNELALFGFSTKEKAEEYILLNKSCLSLNDLRQFFPDTYIPFKKGESATEDISTEQLENLVKSKIQQSV